MGGFIKGISGALGKGFALGIGKAIVFIVLAAILFLLASLFFGLIFLGLSFRFFKTKRAKPFLMCAILATLSISFFVSVLLSNALASNLNLVVILFPAFSIFGIVFAVKKYKIIK